jgi:DNA topoisomerase-6 subunit B
VPGEFYCAATRPPAVYRGNPFLIEVGLAYGGVSTAQKVSLEALTEMLSETDARTLRQFLMNSFDGIGNEASEKILTEAKMGTRQSPAKLSKDEIAQLHAAMRNVNLSEGVMRIGMPTACRCSSSPRHAITDRSSATTGGRMACRNAAAPQGR